MVATDGGGNTKLDRAAVPAAWLAPGPTRGAPISPDSLFHVHTLTMGQYHFDELVRIEEAGSLGNPK